MIDVTAATNLRSPDVAKFCEGINPEASPIVVPIVPDKDAAPFNCFNNVRKKADRDGGRIVTGWAIWRWPGVYVDAEHHAVYEPGPGQPWIDLTPATQPLSARLFLADAAATYDFQKGGVGKENRRLALTSDPLVQQLFKSAHKFYQVRKSSILVTPAIAALLTKIQRENMLITAQLERKYGTVMLS